MDSLLKPWRQAPPLPRVELLVAGWECFSALLFVSAVLPQGFSKPQPLLIFTATLLLSGLLARTLMRRGRHGVDVAAALRVVAWTIAFIDGFDAPQLVAAVGFGLMAGGIRRAAYARLLPASVLPRQPRSLQTKVRPLLAENAMVVGIVGGQAMLLFSVAFLRTASQVVFRAWWEMVPILAVPGTLVFTLALRPLSRPILKALRAGPTGDSAVLENGLAKAQKLPRRLSYLNLAVWIACTTSGVLYLRGGLAGWASADGLSQLAFGLLFSWGVSFYQRGWHEETVAPVIRRLRGWTGNDADEPDPVTLRQRMLDEFGMPLLFTLALSLLSAIGLYRSLGQHLSSADDFSAIAALCASFALLVLAVGSVFARAARRLSTPLSKLARTADQVASGNLGAALPRLSGPSEVVGLGQSVERMRRELASTIEALRAERGGLETRVKQRTAELEGALHELKQAQAALIQGERMALIGELVASVAHEIYNPLNAIGGSISSLDRVGAELAQMLAAYRAQEDALPPENAKKLAELRAELDLAGALDDLEGIAKVVKNATRRSVTIVSNLKSFARAPTASIPTDLHEGLRETLSLLRHRLVHDRVDVKEHFGELPLVTCRAGEINQVFMNLLSNAIAAAVAAHPAGGGVVDVRTRAEGERIFVAISDNGSGVDQAIAERIFDPFFTTKTTEGTGLGLSISREIVSRHGGSLTLSSAPQKSGAVFVLELPRHSRIAPESKRLTTEAGSATAERLRK